MSRVIRIGLIAGLLTAGLALPAIAADKFPSQPMTAYIGFRAGGGTDTIGRVVAHVMSEKLGQQINVVNKTGAGGAIAAMQVMRSKPDGYNFLLSATTSLAGAPLLNKNLKFTIDDFKYVGLVASYQMGLVAPIGKPYNTLKEYIKYARKNPGTKYVTLTPLSRMVMKFVADKEKIKVSFVPAKGGSAVLNLFAANQVDIGYTGGFHQRHPDKMKLLAAVTPKRQPANPEVPTLLDLGYPVALGGQIGVVVPKDTPADIVAKLEAAVKAAVEHPDVIKIAGKFKYPLDYHDAAAATKAVREQRDFYKKLIAAAGSK